MSTPAADPWALMVLALAGELVAPNPLRPGPVLRHRPSDEAPDDEAEPEPR
jgi:hypothetical protein